MSNIHLHLKSKKSINISPRNLMAREMDALVTSATKPCFTKPMTPCASKKPFNASAAPVPGLDMPEARLGAKWLVVFFSRKSPIVLLKLMKIAWHIDEMWWKNEELADVDQFPSRKWHAPRQLGTSPQYNSAALWPIGQLHQSSDECPILYLWSVSGKKDPFCTLNMQPQGQSKWQLLPRKLAGECREVPLSFWVSTWSWLRWWSANKSVGAVSSQKSEPAFWATKIQNFPTPAAKNGVAKSCGATCRYFASLHA